jgi:hypothetical protein
MKKSREPACVIAGLAALLALGVCNSINARGTASSDPPSSVHWEYLDNGQLRVGIDTVSGGCIGYLSRSGSKRNFLNHFDRGRFVQQSYYGDPDGTRWGDKPWRWNPVQGGDYRGTPAHILDRKIKGTSLYVQTMPRHWSGCRDLPEVMFEEWISLTQSVAHVHFKMSYSGTNTYAEADQEIPAVFVEPEFENLVLYSGSRPWSGEPTDRSVPGWPNESRTVTEHWAAYVDKKGFGIGALAPKADKLTCYRFGKGEATTGACSYFAPLTRFAIRPGFLFEYDLYLTVGSVEEIRERFRRIATPGAESAPK